MTPNYYLLGGGNDLPTASLGKSIAKTLGNPPLDHEQRVKWEIPGYMSQSRPRPLGGYLHPTPEKFVGEFITLTPLDLESDLEELFAVSHAPHAVNQIWRYLPVGPFPSAEAMGEFIRNDQSLRGAIPYTVIDNKTGRRVGSISLMRIRAVHGSAELGFIWYEPEAQRTKVNTEANYLLLRYCFESLGYRRMEWKCNSLNEPSQRAARRLGFTFEGIFRQDMIVKGENRDTAWFSILDHEWARIGSAIQYWLYQDDSTPLGKLIQS